MSVLRNQSTITRFQRYDSPPRKEENEYIPKRDSVKTHGKVTFRHNKSLSRRSIPRITRLDKEAHSAERSEYFSNSPTSQRVRQFLHNPVYKSWYVLKNPAKLKKEIKEFAGSKLNVLPSLVSVKTKPRLSLNLRSSMVKTQHNKSVEHSTHHHRKSKFSPYSELEQLIMLL